MSGPSNTAPENGDEIDRALARLEYYALDRSWRPPAVEALQRMQIETPCTLAADYAGFLSRYGPGGFGAGGFVNLPDDCPIGTRFEVDILFGVGSRDSWNPFHLAAETYEGHLPASYLPIATDPGGNLLVCACGSGAVYAWDHEHRELSPGDLDRIAAAAAAAGLDPSRLDLGQLIMFWETRNPTAVRNPTGHGNLYAVANSFTELLVNTTPS
jgi:hypothetical protein